MKLERQLQQVEQEEHNIRKLIKEKRAKQKIKCASCDKFHQINKLECIQTHWYQAPYGCTGGDNWFYGELQFICPITGRRNRLLFDNYDVPWEERSAYDNNPEKQFSDMYKDLFKNVTDTYDESKYKFDNNDYIDENRKKFGLVEKRK